MNEDTSINDRIAQLISEFGLSKADFAKRLGVPPSTISHIVSKRNKPGLDFITSLLSEYKDIDAHWLLTGIHSSRSVARLSPIQENRPDLFSISMKTRDDDDEVVSQSELKKDERNQVFDVPPMHSNASKNIEKIITLYTDNTFSVYLPEE